MKLVVLIAATRGSAMKVHLAHQEHSRSVGPGSHHGPIESIASPTMNWSSRSSRSSTIQATLKGLCFSGDLIFGKRPVIYLSFSSPYSDRWCYVNMDYHVRNVGVAERKLIETFAPDEHELIFQLNAVLARTIINNFAALRKYFNPVGMAAAKTASSIAIALPPKAGTFHSLIKLTSRLTRLILGSNREILENVSVNLGGNSGGSHWSAKRSNQTRHRPRIPGSECSLRALP